MRTLIKRLRYAMAELARRARRPQFVDDPAPWRTSAAEAEPGAQRLQRLCQQCLSGDVAAAELELYAWQRQTECPPAARVLLAALLARRGRTADAVAVLPRARRLEADADALAAKTLVALLVDADLAETAKQVLRQIHDDLGHDPTVTRWLRLMRMPGAEELPRLSDATIDLLAAELLCRPQLIPSLVKAQELEPDADAVTLLRQAISRMALHVFDDDRKLMICQAMSALSQLANDLDDARRWARHGLRLDPHSVPLALTLAQVSDDPTRDADAAAALQRACTAHPDYPDVRRAWIHCEHQQGNIHVARLQLEQWLQRQPGHPVATQLAQELAA